MSIKFRLTLLLGVLLVMFAGALQILRREERKQAAAIASQSIDENEQLLRRWLELTNQSLAKFTQDYAGWDEMSGLVAKPDAVWADKNLKQNLSRYQIHALWVLDGKGGLIYSAQRDDGSPLPCPVVVTALESQPDVHFFSDCRDGLLEIWARPISPDERTRRKTGWLLAARLWDHDFILTLGKLNDAKLQLLPVGAPAKETSPVLQMPLNGVDGKPLRQLRVDFAAVDSNDSLWRDTFAMRLMLLFAALMVAAVWLAVHLWIMRPMGRISESLAREDAAPVRSLMEEPGEFGRMAKLIGFSFAQQRALEREIEEHKKTEASLRLSEERVRQSLELRDRLARDLHDGVIQSIYAAGLGLECALTQMEHEQPAARIRLQHCRLSLNNVIGDVRGFINGLEPERSPHRAFAEELTALANTMQGLSPAQILLQIDPDAAAQLNDGQEVHALQIVRECISNALRHGEAGKIWIAVTRTSSMLSLVIRDDGRGFAPDHATDRGRGLHNISVRAREMGGTLKIDSQPGKGVEVAISFSITAATS